MVPIVAPAGRELLGHEPDSLIDCHEPTSVLTHKRGIDSGPLAAIGSLDVNDVGADRTPNDHSARGPRPQVQAQRASLKGAF